MIKPFTAHITKYQSTKGVIVRDRKLTHIFVGWSRGMQKPWRVSPKLQTYLSENLQICASVNNQNQQVQVTLSRDRPESLFPEQIPDTSKQAGSRASYSSVVKRPAPDAVVLSPQEFESLRFFLPVFDSFYQYLLYVYNKPPLPTAKPNNRGFHRQNTFPATGTRGQRDERLSNLEWARVSHITTASEKENT